MCYIITYEHTSIAKIENDEFFQLLANETN